MDHQDMDHRQEGLPSFWRSPPGIALGVVILVAGFYLVTEHTAHLFGALPYLLVLACPLMHMFMHHGHHHGNRPHGRPGSTDDEQRSQ